MKRSECWMTFTEALEQYLKARETLARPGRSAFDRENAESDMEQASRHMEALTSKEEE